MTGTKVTKPGNGVIEIPYTSKPGIFNIQISTEDLLFCGWKKGVMRRRSWRFAELAESPLLARQNCGMLAAVGSLGKERGRRGPAGAVPQRWKIPPRSRAIRDNLSSLTLTPGSPGVHFRLK